MNYAILRTQKLKTFAQVKACSDHHSRKRKTENADPEVINELLVGSGDPYSDVTKRIREANAHTRSNSVKAIEILLTATPDYFRPHDPAAFGYYEEQPTNDFIKKAVEWLQEYFGKENVVSVSLHLDEATPHVQAVIVPIDETPRSKGPKIRLNAKKWTGDSKKLSKMQDSFANAVKPIGLVRGIKGSAAKHIKLKGYYGTINQAVKKIDWPTIELPDTYFTEKSKMAYVHNQNDEIKKHIKSQILHLIKTSKFAKIESRKKKDYQTTALKFQNQYKLLKKKYEDLEMKYSDIIAKVRDIDLNEVAQKMSLAEKVISGHRHYILHDSEVITVSGKKFYNHYNKVGGGGAIDFVIHCLDCGFNQAVSWLVDKFDLDQATSAVRYYSKKIVKDAVKKKKPYYPPAPDPKLWPQTKKYLLTNRKLDPALVDQLHNQKFLYASEFKGHCNIVFTNKNGTLSEKRGLKSNFKGVEAGSRIDDGGVRITVGKSPKTLVLVESGIDAISYAQLYPDDNY
ncbi:MAG: MobV family relaxase, partial [Bacteroidota bacterium]